MAFGITIESPGACLEGMLEIKAPDRAAIICHPHPLYGGNMDNHVVLAAAEAFLNKGWTVLRFNFRGTGKSSGTFDNGEGEGQDVRAALDRLRQDGYDRIRLTGYSFGARINAAVVSRGAGVEDHIMISPPAAFMSFEEIDRLPDTGLVITGQQDEIGPPDQIRRLLSRWKISPRFEVIENCDHFYSGALGKLTGILEDYLS